MTPDGEPSRETDDQIEIDPRELSGVFAVPQWLRGLGQTSWLLVGITLLLVGDRVAGSRSRT